MYNQDIVTYSFLDILKASFYSPSMGFIRWNMHLGNVESHIQDLS